MRTPLYLSPHLSLELDADRRVVWFVRSAMPHDTLEDAVRMFEDALTAVSRLDTRTHGLLIDVRSVAGRNDPAFEQAIFAARAKLFARFGRRAVVVRTVVGRLQEQRLARESDDDVMAVFHDEQAALAHVAS
jgi:hypothetical protein